jgi:hypothetical protein
MSPTQVNRITIFSQLYALFDGTLCEICALNVKCHKSAYSSLPLIAIFASIRATVSSVLIFLGGFLYSKLECTQISNTLTCQYSYTKV